MFIDEVSKSSTINRIKYTIVFANHLCALAIHSVELLNAERRIFVSCVALHFGHIDYTRFKISSDFLSSITPT